MIGSILVTLADTYSMIIVVYVLMSWIPTSTGAIAQIYAVLGRICDPYLDLFRRFIPPIGGMVDISPVVALFVLEFAVRLLVALL